MKTWLLVVALGASWVHAAEHVLTLNDALALARERHPLLAQAKASAAILDTRWLQARGVLLPQVGLTAQASRAHGAFGRAGTNVGVPTSGTNNFFSLGLSATQTLWDYAAIERLQAAGLTHEAQLATVRAVELTIGLNVRRAYFAASAQRSLLRVAEQTLANNTLHLEQVQALVRSGQRTGIDVAQAQTAVARGKLGVINTKNALQLAMASLALAMGTHPPSDAVVSETPLPALEREADELDALVQSAIEQRPELAALRKQQAALVATTLAAKGGFIPTVAASGGLSEAGAALDTLGLNWNFGVALSWNVFNGLQTTGQVREQEHQAELLQAQLDNELLQVRFDVEQARVTIDAQKAAIDAAQVAVTTAQEQLTLAEARLQAGIGTVLELDDAQVQVNTARGQLVQAQLSLSTARAQLIAALGVTP